VTVDRLLLGVLALALLVRLWGIRDRLPDPTLGINPMVGNTAVDEGDRRAMDFAWRMWRGGTRPLDLNPQTGDWPGLPFYLTLGAQMLYRGYDYLAHGTSAQEFADHVEEDPAGMFLLARILAALLGTLTVLLVYRLGAALWNRKLGLGAALLLALNPFHILISQRVSDPNLLALLFVLLATLPLVRVTDRVAPYATSGAMIGLAAACKYVPMVLLLLPMVANLRPVRWKAIGASILGAALAFFIASPFTLLDWTHKSQSLTLQRGRLLSEWVGLSESSFSLPTYLTRTFPEMLGWPGYLLAVAGTALLFRHRPRGWLVAAVPLLLLLPTGFMALARERFMAPAIGSLVVAAAFAALWCASRIPARASAAAMISLLTVAAAWPVPAYVRLRETLHRPDTRVAAHRWIERAIPGTEPMAIDVYGPEFKPDLEGRLSLIWPFLATQTPLVRAAYHPEWLDGIRYYVSSSEVEGRFETAAARYPDEDRFHRWIRSHGTVVWTSDSTEASGPRIEVRVLPAGISSREERDAAWSQARRAAMYAPRLARWCAEMASIFLRKDDYGRAEEWASRGLSIRETASRRKLLETLALAQVRLDRASEAEETARAALREFPGSPLLHVDRAMALEGLGRNQEAIAEFNRALALESTEASTGIIRAEIARLEARGR
jgi:hypothetical protein